MKRRRLHSHTSPAGADLHAAHAAAHPLALDGCEPLHRLWLGAERLREVEESGGDLTVTPSQITVSPPAARRSDRLRVVPAGAGTAKPASQRATAVLPRCRRAVQPPSCHRASRAAEQQSRQAAEPASCREPLDEPLAALDARGGSYLPTP